MELARAGGRQTRRGENLSGAGVIVALLMVRHGKKHV
jgi:hypothetical protein